jgi:hypothetical protein
VKKTSEEKSTRFAGFAEEGSPSQDMSSPGAVGFAAALRERARLDLERIAIEIAKLEQQLKDIDNERSAWVNEQSEILALLGEAPAPPEPRQIRSRLDREGAQRVRQFIFEGLQRGSITPKTALADIQGLIVGWLDGLHVSTSFIGRTVKAWERTQQMPLIGFLEDDSKECPF